MPSPARALLLQALESDDAAAIDSLLRDHPNLLNAPNERPAVTMTRSVATAEHLLDRGADVEANEYGYTPLRVAVERGRDEIVRLLQESQKAKPD